MLIKIIEVALVFALEIWRRRVRTEPERRQREDEMQYQDFCRAIDNRDGNTVSRLLYNMRMRDLAISGLFAGGISDSTG